MNTVSNIWVLCCFPTKCILTTAGTDNQLHSVLITYIKNRHSREVEERNYRESSYFVESRDSVLRSLLTMRNDDIEKW